MIRLEPIFGPKKPAAHSPNPIIVIRHGFKSNAKPFVPLGNYLQQAFPLASIDNQSYPWRDSVLVNGARLAQHILMQYPNRDLFFIGHSMGGLVCRVANCILRDASFPVLAPILARSLGYAGDEILELKNFQFGPPSLRPVSGLITLATPNSGAMLQGQVSGIAALTQKLLNVFPPTQVSSVADLTTDRLFQIFQNFAVDTPVLSISGSRWNRFATASGQLASWSGLAGIQLDMPHDTVVEDRSVDLSASILPNEIVHQGSSKYLHLRVYEDCTSVTHTNVCDDQHVQNYIVDFIGRC